MNKIEGIIPSSLELAEAKEKNSLIKYGYISGLVGVFIILSLAFIAAHNNVMEKGWKILNFSITTQKDHSGFFILALCALAMFAVEIGIRKVQEKKIISVAPKIINKKYWSYLSECIVKYLIDLTILFFIFQFYRHTNEYGFVKNSADYQPWFSLMDIIWTGYLYLGFPYTLLTRAFQYDPEADKKEPAYLFLKIVFYLLVRCKLIKNTFKMPFLQPNNSDQTNYFGKAEKNILLGIMVKMFFIPLMTVSFIVQFPHLINNFSYVLNMFDKSFSQISFTIMDFYNISFVILVALDVGLAWCGYTISSRWVKNSNFSVEPTLIGWIVAILCYPPYNELPKKYIPVISETAFLQLPYNFFTPVLILISLFGYVVYLLATVSFGLRFSNLTHRGIISNGLYSIVRHPAYAAKNFAWWCVILPVIIFAAINQKSPLILLWIIGLIGTTWLYYLRAITEEKHLLEVDPEYQEYCKKVPYKFIPGIL